VGQSVLNMLSSRRHSLLNHSIINVTVENRMDWGGFTLPATTFLDLVLPLRIAPGPAMACLLACLPWPA
jgi:hypothetical protein